VAGQGAASLQSFIGAMLMVRFGTQTEFGRYTTIVAGVNFVTALQVAVVTGPLLVLAPGLPDREKRAFTGSLWLFNTVLTVATLVVAAGAWGTLRMTGTVGADQFTTFVIAISYLFINQAQEFFRRVLQMHRAFFTASLCDTVTLVVVAACMAITWMLKRSRHVSLDAADGLLILGISGGTGLALSLYECRQLLTFHRGRVITAVKEAWTIGGWTILTILCDTLFSYSSTYIVAGVMGAAAVGRLEAPRLLAAPILVFSNGLRNYLLPTVSALVATGANREALRKMTRGIVGTAIVVGCYCLVLALVPVDVVTRIFGAAYANSAGLLRWWAGMYFFMSVSAIPWIAVLVMRRQNLGALVQFVLGCGVTLGIWLAARSNSLTGVVAVRTIASCALMTTGIWLGSHLLRTARIPQASTLTAEPDAILTRIAQR
jgi:O-antigen/teichoic acid export membrane protein